MIAGVIAANVYKRPTATPWHEVDAHLILTTACVIVHEDGDNPIFRAIQSIKNLTRAIEQSIACIIS